MKRGGSEGRRVGDLALAKLGTAFKGAGAEKEDQVVVDISYDIIRHVSAQLYTNPRKAIEELITNSYDAGATECWVRLPKTTDEALVVLDNGKSMNLEGLKDLWKVARSPKVKHDDEDAPRIDNNRMQIGKFGVGKLAAFALGGRLTHITCVKNQVRVVSVGQAEIKERAGGKPPTFDVYKLPLSKAKPVLEALLAELPKPWDNEWDSWTLALVEEIDSGTSGRALKVGVLKRMITNSLPISADFKVYLEKELIPKREITPDEIEVRIDVTNAEFRKRVEEALKAYWATVLTEEDPENVPTKYYKVKVETVLNPQNVSQGVKALIVPELGPVIGHAILTKSSLTTAKLIERGYSNNGFAIYANGKLVNPEDELFGVTQRSHTFWRRFLARVEIPGLDRVLLVQRNAVSEKSNEAQITRELLRTLFNYTRNQAEKLEESDDYVPKPFGSRVRALSPILGGLALSGLAKEGFPAQGLDSLEIDFATLGEDGPAAKYDPESKKILINEDHPLVAALDDLDPGASKPLRHMIGEVMAGTEMAKGYLGARGVGTDIVEETGEIVEVALRSAANFVRDEVEEHIKAIDEASYEGDTPFEKAVVTAFRSLRLAALHMGESDQPDGIIEIPVSGKPNVRISVEAKGTKGIITHTELSEATVTRHSGESGCTNAIAIAREFGTGGKGGKDSALLRETKGKVPLITVEGMATLLRLHKRRPFTYDKIAKILTTWTHPGDLVKFIEETWREMPDLGRMKLVLKVAHELVAADDSNYPDPGMVVADPRCRAKKVTKEQVIHILEAIQIGTQMVLIRDRKNYEFELLAPTETILEALQRDPDEGVAPDKTPAKADGPKP